MNISDLVGSWVYMGGTTCQILMKGLYTSYFPYFIFKQIMV